MNKSEVFCDSFTLSGTIPFRIGHSRAIIVMVHNDIGFIDSVSNLLTGCVILLK
ncbi:hypothetical protein L0665_02055 [Methanogenium marinum]|uniref:Uncharacterized protein n=1 Tax=Methanogenium marinum TaxID=348610 RepID=A0A9Q4PVB1_9EURY|nr:hypothetical protein [Methanogenium marinum]MDE4907404.1 hypothetical protein [Methanogenium marinum]